MKRVLLTLLCSVMSLSLSAKSMTSSDVKEIVSRVNNYWQSNNKPEKTFFWHQAAYHTGNMEAYYLTGDEAFLEYSMAWSEHNKWWGSVGTDKSKWKYNYGETPDHALFGDSKSVSRYMPTYTRSMAIKADSVLRGDGVSDADPKDDYIWWSDGLYMVMPVMTKMYKATNNPKYLDKLYEYVLYADKIMYDEDLYYRDARYVYQSISR